MIRTAILLAALTGPLTATPAAFAGPEDDLRACYAQVIRACDGAARSGICADAGMESCDDMHYAGVTLSPEVIARITEGDLVPRFFTPLPEIADATPMPIPVMPSPVPVPEPEETTEVTPEPEDEDGIDPELAAILGLIETLAGL
jgi:hypothetical protein